jgi:two-component system copper resistance phosphate regulon response regulator CusR
MHILIIEDEKKTSAFLSKGLTESGYIIDSTENGDEGLLLALDISYDLIILDVMLPGRNGWSILSTIRQAGKQMPVLFLTAMDAVQYRVKGLELGADDYLIKPFAFSELLARVRLLLRRAPVRPSETLQIADLEIEFTRRKATRSGTRLCLTSKEFALLSLLMLRAGEVLSRTLIAEQIWDINFDSDTNIIDVAIRRLRRKVDDPFEKKLIHTVRGVGYVFEDL